MKRTLLALALVLALAIPASAMHLGGRIATGAFLSDSGQGGVFLETDEAARSVIVQNWNANHPEDQITPADVAVFPLATQADIDAYRGALAAGGITLTWSGDAITGWSDAPSVYLHFTIAGGDGDDPPGANIDGSNPLQISVALRQTADPASPIINKTATWRITIRGENGGVYDVRKITLTNGTAGPFNYSGIGLAAACEIRQSDFDPITAGDTTYNVNIVGHLWFKFYSTL